MLLLCPDHKRSQDVLSYFQPVSLAGVTGRSTAHSLNGLRKPVLARTQSSSGDALSSGWLSECADGDGGDVLSSSQAFEAIANGTEIQDTPDASTHARTQTPDTVFMDGPPVANDTGNEAMLRICIYQFVSKGSKLGILSCCLHISGLV
jgi:hypothetical protein